MSKPKKYLNMVVNVRLKIKQTGSVVAEWLATQSTTQVMQH